MGLSSKGHQICSRSCIGEEHTLQKEESKGGSREGRKAFLKNQYIDEKRYM
jgi:hypothetical protein